MGHRTRSKARCLRCRLRTVLCVCEFIPQFDVATRLVVLIHYKEIQKPTNTGGLAAVVLPNSEVRIRGLKAERSEAGDGLVDPNRQTLLLYPDDNAQVLTKELVQSFGKPITLVVPDGNWRQACKVKSRETGLQGVLCVKLPEGPPTQYKLRRETKNNGLSTFEAIARTMGIIEGEHIQEAMEKLFNILVERTLWSRGKLTAEECLTGIPQEAIESHSQSFKGAHP